MNINIKTIPNESQRYDTRGDYFYNDDGDLSINISKMDNEDYEFLVAVHEFIESYLCKKHGIEEKDITAFDILHLSSDEPGDLKDAPYYNEHKKATMIEMILAYQLGIDWSKYNTSLTEDEYNEKNSEN